MTMTSSEMAQKSVAARIKKYGGRKGFAAHMKKVSHARKRKLDKSAIPTSNA